MADIPTIQLIRDYKRIANIPAVGSRGRLLDTLMQAIWVELVARKNRALRSNGTPTMM